MHSETAAILALMLSPGGGPVTIRRLLTQARQARVPLNELLRWPASRLAALAPSGQEHLAQVALDCGPRYQERAAELLDRTARAGITVLQLDDADYPDALRRHLGESAPPLLFLYGDQELLATDAAAVVGAREVSEGGALLAADCAQTFSRAGLTVISGGAAGVDSAAHAAAVETGGKTIVVLPQGLLTYRAPALLLAAVEDGRGLLLSEFAPDAGWQTHAAVTRNATISALARLICVIEPHKTGGSVRTARCGLKQGKRVLVHGKRGPDSPIKALLQAGAQSLLDAAGQFSPERVLNLWKTASDKPLTHQELF